MPGNYTHATRNTGDNITAAIYNTDHQNHIDNLEPSKMDDYSATATQMRTTADPGESGSESLATTLAGELERLRHAVKELRAAIDPSLSYWYQTQTRPMARLNAQAATVSNATTTTLSWTASVNTHNFFSAGAPTILTVPYSGNYDVTAGARWASNSVGLRIVQIVHNDVTILAESSINANANSAQVISTGLIALTAGDTLSVKVYQTSGGDLGIDGAWTNMLSAIWISG